ncbi:unnamed protein product [Phytophthora fragariaefolia]|uniref:Unnamed protein product n=1 Tax=Phytophthora fragariaefolia TaxID=1490495 RepID=A0A9W7CNP4_9STRA|nr:unnamed protein product [Phytophthora fragariaefolia]
MKACAPNIGSHAQDNVEYGGSANVVLDECISNGYIHPKPMLSQPDQGYTVSSIERRKARHAPNQALRVASVRTRKDRPGRSWMTFAELDLSWDILKVKLDAEFTFPLNTLFNMLTMFLSMRTLRIWIDIMTNQPPWNRLNVVDAYTTGNLSDSEAEEIDVVENQEENNENVMPEEVDPGGPRDVEHIPAELELATMKEEDDELAEDGAPEHAIVAIDAGNGMDTCLIPEHLTGVQRSSFEGELEDVQDIKRQRDSEGQPRKMTLRSSEERRVPPRYDDYQLYTSYCERRSQGFENTLTEPCRYVYCKYNVFALIPLYVDDVVLATNSEEFKTTLFAAMDKKYGFKGGGRAKPFLDIQMKQSAEGIRVHYCKEVQDRYGFKGADQSATPMETNAKFSQGDAQEIKIFLHLISAEP